MKNTIISISVLTCFLFTGYAFAGEVKDVVPEIVKVAADPVMMPARLRPRLGTR